MIKATFHRITPKGYHFLSRGYQFAKRVRRKIINLLRTTEDNHYTEPAKNQLLFVFSGRQEGWPTIGRELYRTDELFRTMIQDSNSTLVEHGGAEIISYFEDSPNLQVFDDEAKFTIITAIQIATIAVYNRNGIFPNAVMGISMGEAAAAYAAGALTAKEAILVSLSYMTLHKVDPVQHVFLFLNLSFEEASVAVTESPVWMEIIYEDNAGAVLVSCHNDDLKALELFLSSRGYQFKLASGERQFVPCHTSAIRSYEKVLQKFHQEITPKPLKCDYYSPTLGRVIPRNAILSSDYWYDLSCVPVLFHRTLQAVLNDGYQTFLQVGPPGISDRQLKSVTTPAAFEVLYTFQAESNEIVHHDSLIKKLSVIQFENTDAGENEEHTLNNFRQNFNIYGEDITERHYEYLRNYGSIHFLPQMHSWIVLSYNEAEQVLKQPEVFSSSLLKAYDPILLGADPEVHQVIRKLLQPIFSPAVISELALSTTSIAEELLKELCKQDEFDFVKDYSDRISILVLCKFVGLSSEDADKMVEFTGKDYHNPLYWEKLEEFFRVQFMDCELTKEDSLWGELRSLVKKEEFVFTDAVSLLKIIWTAGMATTSALISTSINITLRRPVLARQIVSDDKLVARFIEECLRLQAPLSAVFRITNEPADLSGQQIPVNTPVIVHLKSAMRDPAHYENPGDFSLSRPAKKHLAFGAGIHQCIGMGMARAETRSALIVVLSRIDELNSYKVGNPEYTKGSDLVTMTSLKMYR